MESIRRAVALLNKLQRTDSNGSLSINGNAEDAIALLHQALGFFGDRISFTPIEVLERICLFVHPHQIARLSRLSRFFHSVIRDPSFGASYTFAVENLSLVLADAERVAARGVKVINGNDAEDEAEIIEFADYGHPEFMRYRVLRRIKYSRLAPSFSAALISLIGLSKATAIEFVCRFSQREALRLLKKHEYMQIPLKGWHFRTALDLAAEFADSEFMEHIIKTWPDSYELAVVIGSAIMGGRLDNVLWLLSHPDGFDDSDPNWYSMFSLAICRPNGAADAIAWMVLDQPTDVFDPADHHLALVKTARLGKVDFIRALLERETVLRDAVGMQKALHEAVTNRHLEAAELILNSMRADPVSELNRALNTAFTVAELEGEGEVGEDSSSDSSSERATDLISAMDTEPTGSAFRSAREPVDALQHLSPFIDLLMRTDALPSTSTPRDREPHPATGSSIVRFRSDWGASNRPELWINPSRKKGVMLRGRDLLFRKSWSAQGDVSVMREEFMGDDDVRTWEVSHAGRSKREIRFERGGLGRIVLTETFEKIKLSDPDLVMGMEVDSALTALSMVGAAVADVGSMFEQAMMNGVDFDATFGDVEDFLMQETAEEGMVGRAPFAMAKAMEIMDTGVVDDGIFGGSSSSLGSSSSSMTERRAPRGSRENYEFDIFAFGRVEDPLLSTFEGPFDEEMPSAASGCASSSSSSSSSGTSVSSPTSTASTASFFSAAANQKLAKSRELGWTVVNADRSERWRMDVALRGNGWCDFKVVPRRVAGRDVTNIVGRLVDVQASDQLIITLTVLHS
ncbi:hypothetical protein HK101_008086 [Irineochytrium annulatum]|nr:hypothetical protein HK101_008086 [Irineochytrium annulatum]